jgi:transposase-like protein
MGQRRWSAADRQRAVSVYAARGLAAAARETGIPHPNIARWAKAAGVTTSPATPALSAPEPGRTEPPPVPALPPDLGAQLRTVRTALLRRVLAQLDQSRPLDLRAAAQLLQVVDDLARRHRPVPADAAGQLAELNRILDDLEGSNVRQLPRKRRKA